MSVAHIGKLQENTAALCKIAAKSSGWVLSADPDMSVRRSWNALLSHLASEFRMQYIRVEWWQQISGCNTSGWKRRQPDVKWRRQPGVKWRQPDGMARQPDGIPSRVECAGSHTPCILDLLKDSKELSSISDCFGDQKAIKTPKLNTIWLELITRVLNMLIGLKGDNYYSKVFKRVNYKLWNSTFWVVIKCLVNKFSNSNI